MTTPLLDRALAKVRYDHGCWLWTGATTKGYGVIQRGGRSGNVLVHRAVYEATTAAIQAGLDLDHLCRNRSCCNPIHLEPVTRSVNLRRGATYDASRAITHCPSGHEYTPENLRNRGKGRECRECHRIACAERQRRKRAAA